jgi:hypothetical protein
MQFCAAIVSFLYSISCSDTVSVLELLAKTQSYTSVDPVLVTGIKRWIQQRQEEDGSFSPLPTDIALSTSRNLSGSQLLDHQVETTAETLITLLQVGLESEVSILISICLSFELNTLLIKSLFKDYQILPKRKTKIFNVIFLLEHSISTITYTMKRIIPSQL